MGLRGGGGRGRAAAQGTPLVPVQQVLPLGHLLHLVVTSQRAVPTVPAAPAACREGRLYLRWLMGQLGAAGCTMEQRRVASVGELAPSYDIVVNCAGGLPANLWALTGTKGRCLGRARCLLLAVGWNEAREGDVWHRAKQPDHCSVPAL